MTENPYVFLVASGVARTGRAVVHEFYANKSLPNLPADLELTSLSQTVGADRIVEEMVMRFTHTIEMDWLLPGVRPTRRSAEFALVGLVQFKSGKIAAEHLYWDQATVLSQLGLPNHQATAGFGSADGCCSFEHRLLAPRYRETATRTKRIAGERRRRRRQRVIARGRTSWVQSSFTERPESAQLSHAAEIGRARTVAPKPTFSNSGGKFRHAAGERSFASRTDFRSYPEIGRLNFFVVGQFLAAPVQDYFSAFQHVGALHQC